MATAWTAPYSLQLANANKSVFVRWCAAGCRARGTTRTAYRAPRRRRGRAGALTGVGVLHRCVASVNVWRPSCGRRNSYVRSDVLHSRISPSLLSATPSAQALCGCRCAPFFSSSLAACHLMPLRLTAHAFACSLSCGLLLASSWRRLGVLLASYWLPPGLSWPHLGFVVASYWPLGPDFMAFSWPAPGILLASSWFPLGLLLASWP